GRGVGAGRDIDELLARCGGVAILATSRTVLGLRAEREYPVQPLQLPASADAAPVGELTASPAVALFVDRARAVRPGFALTRENAAAGGEAGRRPGGLPAGVEPGGPPAPARGPPHPAAGPPRAAGPPGRVARRARDRRGGPPRAPAHPAGHGRVERGPAR